MAELFGRQAVLYEFFQGQSVDEAHEHILRAHYRHKDEFPMMMYQEVEFWYRKFRNGDRTLKGDYKADQNAPKIIDLPVELLQAPLNNAKNKLQIQILLRTNSITLIQETLMNGNEQYTYTETKTGCLRTKHDGEKENYNSTFLEKGIEDFQNVIGEKAKIITCLTIKYDHTCGVDISEKRNQFYFKIVEAMQKCAKKLHVEHLCVTVENPNELLSVLKNIKVGPLKRLQLSIHSLQSLEFVDATEIRASAHWQNIETFLSAGKPFNLRIGDFTRMRVTVVAVYETTLEEVLNHKNSILELPSFDHHIFELNMAIDEKALVKTLQPFIPMDDFDKVAGKFPIPGSSGNFLKFSYTVIGLMFEKQMLTPIVKPMDDFQCLDNSN